MVKKLILPATFSIIIIFFLILIIQNLLAYQKADTFTIHAGHGHSVNHSYNKAMEFFKKSIETESLGKLMVEIIPDEKYGSERQMMEMVSAGSLEMEITSLISQLEPIFSVLEMPYLIKDRNHIRNIIQSGIVYGLDKRLQTKGIKVIGLMEVGYRNITSNKPIYTPNDMAGLLFRVPEKPVPIETIKSFGAKPVIMSFPKVYEALRLNVVDGQENPLENILDGKLYEQQKFVSMTRHSYNFTFVIVSTKFWKKLSRQYRDMIERNIRLACDFQINYKQETEARFEKQLKNAGLRFIYPDVSDFEKASKPVYRSPFISNLGNSGTAFLEKIYSLTNHSMAGSNL